MLGARVGRGVNGNRTQRNADQGHHNSRARRGAFPCPFFALLNLRWPCMSQLMHGWPWLEKVTLFCGRALWHYARNGLRPCSALAAATGAGAP
jgi:hypothetical protein